MAKKAKTKKTPRLIRSLSDLPSIGKARRNFFIKVIQPYIDNKLLDLNVHQLACTLQSGRKKLKNKWFDIEVLKEDQTILFDTMLHAGKKIGIMVPFKEWEESRKKPKKTLLVGKKELLSSPNQSSHKEPIIDFNENSDAHLITDNKIPEASFSPSSYSSSFNFFKLPILEPNVDNFNFDLDRLNRILVTL